MTCINCQNGVQYVSEKFVVSREMAMDAGDSSMAGEVLVEEIEITCICCGGRYWDCDNCDGD